MRDAGNILSVAKLMPDYMGFIFYPKSPRFVGEGFRLPEDFPNAIKRTGVFVNAVLDEIMKQVKTHSLDAVQLHGHETPFLCKALKEEGVSVIKAFSVDDAFDFETTKPYRDAVDFFLFDTKGKYFGGNAKVFDWRVLQRYDQQVPFFLSGGLSPENVTDVVSLRGMNLYALDVNSGVEDSPGVKNIDRVQELVSLRMK